MHEASMDQEYVFRNALLVGLLIVFPIMLYHRIKARSREPLDRRQEGVFILATLRPVGLVMAVSLITYTTSDVGASRTRSLGGGFAPLSAAGYLKRLAGARTILP
jgi:hypothetical protein